MVFVGLFLFCLIMAVVMYKIKGGLEDASGDPTIAVMWIVFAILLAVIITASLGKSWTENVEMHVIYDGTVEQYRDAITMYQDVAVINMSVAFTDFKYEGYQDNIAGFVIDLRSQISHYNKLLIEKRMAKRNIFMNILTFYDRSLPLIKLTD